VASWLYDLRDDRRRPSLDGVMFRSRYGDDLRMWAFFERTAGRRHRSDRVEPGRTYQVTAALPALAEAMRRHGLTWAGPRGGVR
jgi:hypothetical protein